MGLVPEAGSRGYGYNEPPGAMAGGFVLASARAAIGWGVVGAEEGVHVEELEVGARRDDFVQASDLHRSGQGTGTASREAVGVPDRIALELLRHQFDVSVLPMCGSTRSASR